jgi:adenosylcobinamide-phosphate synthase
VSHSTLHFATNLTVLAGALLIEAAMGYPQWLFRTMRHPVVWIGALLGWLDRNLNDDDASDLMRFSAGAFALAIVLVIAVAPPVLALKAMAAWAPLPWVIMVLCSFLLAQRSLFSHIRSVAEALEASGLAGGREAVSHVVGRNPETLDEAGVVRAAIESLAENFSDAVVAPSLWCLLFGLPGMLAYKTINTADSVIGHQTRRHAAFGRAAARLDDLVNLPASRIAGVWLVLAALLHPKARSDAAWHTMWRDARHHRSPNAGWPEAAIAGALGLRLAGPRVYGASRIDDAWMGDGRAEATTADLRRALSLYRLACGLQIAFIVALAIIVRG